MIDRRITPPLLTPGTIVSRGGKFTVSIQGVEVDVVESRAKATTLLCREAIKRQETLIVHVVDGPSRMWLTITSDGTTSPSSPPAAGTLRPNLASAQTPEQQVESATANWVEDNILGSSAPPPPAPKKRFGFGRKR